MSNGMYTGGKVALLKGDIDLANDSVSALLVDLSVYTPNLSTDNFQDDIPIAAVIAEETLTGKSVTTDAKFLADDTTFTSVTSSSAVTGIVVLHDTGRLDTSKLICLFDTSPNFPIVPDGTDIVVKWDSTEGILAL
jgi:hypothetical protein